MSILYHNFGFSSKYIGFSYVVGSIINVLLLIMILPFWGIMIVPIALGISRIVNYLILYRVVQSKGLLELPNKYILYFIVYSFHPECVL